MVKQKAKNKCFPTRNRSYIHAQTLHQTIPFAPRGSYSPRSRNACDFSPASHSAVITANVSTLCTSPGIYTSIAQSCCCVCTIKSPWTTVRRSPSRPIVSPVGNVIDFLLPTERHGGTLAGGVCKQFVWSPMESRESRRSQMGMNGG